MKARFSVVPNEDKFDIEIFDGETGYFFARVKEEDLDKIIDDFRHEHGPYEMIQVFNGRPLKA